MIYGRVALGLHDAGLTLAGQQDKVKRIASGSILASGLIPHHLFDPFRWKILWGASGSTHRHCIFLQEYDASEA